MPMELNFPLNLMILSLDFIDLAVAGFTDLSWLVVLSNLGL